MRNDVSVTPSIRMEIFRRDGYTCQYCGVFCGDSPDIDHIVPRAKGGSNKRENLVTACPSCNRAKRDSVMEIPDSVRAIVEREKKIRRDLHAIQTAYSSWFLEAGETRLRQFSEATRTMIRTFLKTLDRGQIRESLLEALGREGIEDPIRYFYAICWRKIKEMKA